METMIQKYLTQSPKVKLSIIGHKGQRKGTTEMLRGNNFSLTSLEGQYGLIALCNKALF